MDRNDDSSTYPPYVIVTLLPPKNNDNDNETTSLERRLSYRCNFCHFASETKDSISKHISNHIFQCSLCQYATFMQHKLLLHKQEVHGRGHPIPYDLLTLDGSHVLADSAFPCDNTGRIYNFPLPVKAVFQDYSSVKNLAPIQNSNAVKDILAASTSCVTARQCVETCKIIKHTETTHFEADVKSIETPFKYAEVNRSCSNTSCELITPPDYSVRLLSAASAIEPIITRHHRDAKRCGSSTSPKASLVDLAYDTIDMTSSCEDISIRETPDTAIVDRCEVFNLESMCYNERQESFLNLPHIQLLETCKVDLTTHVTCEPKVTVCYTSALLADASKADKVYATPPTSSTEQNGATFMSPKSSIGANYNQMSPLALTLPQSIESHSAPTRLISQNQTAIHNLSQHTNFADLSVSHMRMSEAKRWTSPTKKNMAKHAGMESVSSTVYFMNDGDIGTSLSSSETVYENVSHQSSAVTTETAKMTINKVSKRRGRRKRPTEVATVSQPLVIDKQEALVLNSAKHGDTAEEVACDDAKSFSTGYPESECSEASLDTLSSADMDNQRMHNKPSRVLRARPSRSNQSYESAHHMFTKATGGGNAVVVPDLTITTSVRRSPLPNLLITISQNAVESSANTPPGNPQIISAAADYDCKQSVAQKHRQLASCSSSLASPDSASNASSINSKGYNKSHQYVETFGHPGCNFDFCDDEPPASLSRPGSKASSYKELVEGSMSDSSDSVKIKHKSGAKKRVKLPPARPTPPRKPIDFFASPPDESQRVNSPSQAFLDPENSEEKRRAQREELKNQQSLEMESNIGTKNKGRKGKKDEPLVISVEQYRSMSNPVGAKSTSLDIRDSGGRFMGIFPRVPSNNLDIAFTTVPVKLAGQTNAIPMTIKYRQQVVKCDDQGNLEHGGVYRDVEKEVHIADSDNETGRGEAAAPNADSNNGTGGPPPAKRIWLSTSTCAIKPETKPIKNEISSCGVSNSSYTGSSAVDQKTSSTSHDEGPPNESGNSLPVFSSASPSHLTVRRPTVGYALKASKSLMMEEPKPQTHIGYTVTMKTAQQGAGEAVEAKQRLTRSRSTPNASSTATGKAKAVAIVRPVISNNSISPVKPPPTVNEERSPRRPTLRRKTLTRPQPAQYDTGTQRKVTPITFQTQSLPVSIPLGGTATTSVSVAKTNKNNTSPVSSISSAGSAQVPGRRLRQRRSVSTDGLRRQPARGKISLLKRAIDALHKAVEPPGNYSFRTNQLPQKRKTEPSLFGDLSGTETEEVPELLLRLPTRHLTPSPVKRDSCILPPAEQLETHFAEVLIHTEASPVTVDGMIDPVPKLLPLFHSHSRSSSLSRIQTVTQPQTRAKSQDVSPPESPDTADYIQAVKSLLIHPLPTYQSHEGQYEGLREAMTIVKVEPLNSVGIIGLVGLSQSESSVFCADRSETAEYSSKIVLEYLGNEPQYVHKDTAIGTVELYPSDLSTSECFDSYASVAKLDHVNVFVTENDSITLHELLYAAEAEPPLVLQSKQSTIIANEHDYIMHHAPTICTEGTSSPLTVENSLASRRSSSSDESFRSAAEFVDCSSAPSSPYVEPQLMYTMNDSTDSDTPAADRTLTSAAQVEPVIVDIASQYCCVTETSDSVKVQVADIAPESTTEAHMSPLLQQTSSNTTPTAGSGTPLLPNLSNAIKSAFKSNIQLAFQKGAMIKKAQKDGTRPSLVQPSEENTKSSSRHAASAKHAASAEEALDSSVLDTSMPTIVCETYSLLTPKADKTISSKTSESTPSSHHKRHKDKHKLSSDGGSPAKSKKSKKDKKHKKHKHKSKDLNTKPTTPILPQRKNASPQPSSKSNHAKDKSSHSNLLHSTKKKQPIYLEDTLIFYPVPVTPSNKHTEPAHNETGDKEKKPHHQDKPREKNSDVKYVSSSSSSKFEHKQNGVKTVEKKRKSADQPEKSEKRLKLDQGLNESKVHRVKSKSRDRRDSHDRSRSATPVIDLISPGVDADSHRLPWSNKTIKDVCRCDMCDFISIEMDDLIEHKKETHAVRTKAPPLAHCEFDPPVNPDVEYKCTLCGLSDTKLRSIRDHITSEHHSKLRTCERVTHSRNSHGFSLLVETVRVYRDLKIL